MRLLVFSPSQTDQLDSPSVIKYNRTSKLILNIQPFSTDGTTQICSVFGPGEVRLMKELAERAYVNIVYKPRIGNTSERTNHASLIPFYLISNI